MPQTKHFAAGSVKPPTKPGVLRCYQMKFCPFGQRCVLTLHAKKIPHEIVLINTKNKPEWYLDVNVLGLVSSLEKDGKVIIESLGNMEFLDYLYPENPLQHADPWKRYHDRGLVDVFASKVISPFFQIALKNQEPEQEDEIFEKMVKGLEIFEKELQQRKTPFFGGDKPGFLDYAIWPWFERMPVLGFIRKSLHFPKERLPLLAEFIEEMMKDEAVAQVYIEPQYHRDVLAKSRMGEIPDYDIDTNQKVTTYIQ